MNVRWKYRHQEGDQTNASDETSFWNKDTYRTENF
jgi:hypothetical protein